MCNAEWHRYFLEKILVLLVIAGSFSCVSDSEAQRNPEADPRVAGKGSDLKFWTWITASASKSDEAYSAEFNTYRENGIDAVLIDTAADPELLQRLVPLAKKAGLEVHAWLFTLNRPGDKVALQHPEWFVVSRDGRSAFEDPPYVDHYKFLCPTRKESREHVLGLVEELALVQGVESVHLDYIRFPDVFLPIGLLPKYNLRQEKELPEFDFCYCEVCVETFEEIHHKDPRELEDPSLDVEWKQFRANQIKRLVDAAYEIAQTNGKKLSAAVFPYPAMADRMVRQRWDKWQVDMVLPMVYHGFYNEELDWIGFVTRQGVSDLEGRSTELHTGIFLPGMSGEEVFRAIILAKENGAKGVSFFYGGAFTEERFEALRRFKAL